MAIDASGYFVWNPDDREPRFRHVKHLTAIAEAERLAALHPGQQFIVLKAIGSAIAEKPATFKWADGCRHHIDDDMPF